MILKQLYVKHFRCLLDESVPLEPITALVGTNGSGKSNILHCLNFFYSPSYPTTKECYFDRQTAQPLSVTLTFGDLTSQEVEIFSGYTDKGELSITKEATWTDSGVVTKYHGSRLQCPAFAGARAISSKTEKKGALGELVDSGLYAGLAKVSKGEDVEAALLAWEAEHPDHCQRARDDGQFFRFTNVGRGKIDSFSRWVFIPAVRDAAADGVEGKGNALKELLDLLLRPQLDANPDLQALRQEASRKYREILDPENLGEMKALGQSLTERLQRFAPQTTVHLAWQNLADVSLPSPSATTQVGEGDFLAPVEYSGHGTQRAFLIVLLQHLCETRIASKTDAPTATPHILLGIEEPELYLHPIRARLISRILRELSVNSDGQTRVQSVYGTHSPLFVDIQEADAVRLVRRFPNEMAGRPGTSRVSWTSLDAVAKDLARHYLKDPALFTGTTLRPRLVSVMTSMVNEGFFSDYIVLVEGEEDRAYVLAGAALKKADFESAGISVIAVDGKTNLDRPYLIFTALGIPCFVVFDGDKGNEPATNEALLRMLGQTPAKAPATQQWGTGACFEADFKSTVLSELGSRFAELLTVVASEFGYERPSEAHKNAKVVAETLRRCAEEGLESKTLGTIVDRVVTLPSQPRPARTATAVNS